MEGARGTVHRGKEQVRVAEVWGRPPQGLMRLSPRSHAQAFRRMSMDPRAWTHEHGHMIVDA
eukprot:351133-Chlamydomonas_euryale.AAC.16